MWNKFRIWLNRNDFKIFVWVICIIGIYILLSGSTGFFSKISSSNTNDDDIENTTLLEDDKYNEENAIKLDSSQEEYKEVKLLEEKIINTIYNANKTDDTTIKQDLVNICSEQFKENLKTPKRTITTDNILIFVSKISDTKYYSVQDIYKYGEENNVAKYIVILRFDNKKTVIEDSCWVINIDKNNNTFSFDGQYMSMENVYESATGFDSIEKNESNSLN